MNQFGRLVKMFKELSSYAKDAIKNYTLTGIPVQRALSSEFPQDMHSREIEHQYMYGDDLLVAMVTKVVYLWELWANFHKFNSYNASQFSKGKLFSI